MATWLRRVGPLVVVAALGLAPPAVGAERSTRTAAADDLTVVSVTVSPASDTLADGFAELVVDVALRSSAPIPDVLDDGGLSTQPVVLAERTGGIPSWLVQGEDAPATISWRRLSRVSGTATDGVWRGTALTSPIHTGGWLVTEFSGVVMPAPEQVVDVSGFGATVRLGTTGPVWKVLPAPAAPVEIVKGTETWVPRARVTHRVTGRAQSTPWVEYDFFGAPYTVPAVQYPPGSLTQLSDGQGYITLGRRPVNLSAADPDRHVIQVFRSRATAGYSWEVQTVLWPWVKWRASQEITASGRTVTAIGKAWPAPSIYRAANPNVYLQQLHGRTWRTVGSSRVRANGRYTVTWTAPSSGRWALRVYKPGGFERNGQMRSTGTVLPTVWLTTR